MSWLVRLRSDGTAVNDPDADAGQTLSERHPQLTSRLWDLGATGVLDDPGTTTGPPQLVVGFDDEAHARQAVELALLCGLVGAVESVAEHWYPTDVTSASVMTARGPVTFELAPGPTFGHGAHPTTALALEMMGRLPAGGRLLGRVLDLGCGSGVLTIAAHHLGASSITAIDVDPVAVATAEANVARNGAQAHCSTITTDELAAAGRRYDTVLANVLVDVHEQVAEAVIATLTAGGSIITAGYLDHQRARVIAAYRNRRPTINETRTAHNGEWCGAWLVDDVRHHH